MNRLAMECKKRLMRMQMAMKARKNIAVVLFCALVMSLPGRVALSQSGPGRAPAGERMTETKLDRSVAALVAEGWQIVAVSQSGPAFAYHLVREGGLAICYFNLAEQPPNSLCYRMAPVR